MSKELEKLVTSKRPHRTLFYVVCFSVFLELQPIVFVFSQPGNGL
jgi:hypothetical protein